MGQVFQVLTEFKFEASGAVAESKVLKAAVDGVSDAADGALNSLKSLSLGAVGALGIGSFLGLLKSAVEVSDNFHRSTLDFATVIATNMQYLQGATGTFNERLSVTHAIMENIAKTADKMQLSQGDLFGVVKSIVPTLAPHGAAGDNFSNATSLASSALVAGGNLGLGAGEIGRELKNVLGGTAEGGGLFGRLGATSAFKGGGGADTINAMAFKDRLKIVQAGLDELGNDLGMVAARSNLLSVQLDRLKNVFFGDESGMGSILKPLGDALRMPLVEMLKGVNSYIRNEGGQIVGNLAQLVKSMVKKPEEMIVDLLQLRNLRGDLGKAKDTVQVIGAVTGIGAVLKFLTGNARFLNPAIGVTAGLFMVLRDAFHRANDPISKFVGHVLLIGTTMGIISAILVKLGMFWGVLKFALVEILAPLALFTVLFQALSRAQAKAHVEDAEALFNIAPKLSELMVRLKMAFSNITAPLRDIIEGWSELFKPFFAWGTILAWMMPILQVGVSILEAFGQSIVGVMGIISGLITMLYQIIDNAVHFKNPLAGTQEAFKNGFDDYVKSHLQKMDNGENVSNRVTNIGKVEIKNEFKENQEPDRIAFTVKDQLLKAAQNPTQAKGRSLQAAWSK